MSRRTLRFTEAELSGGKLGTASVRDRADSGSAAGLGLPAPGVPRELAAIDYSTPASAVARTQALGRMKAGRMNKTEAAYAQVLDGRRHAGQIAWFQFEAVKLRLADNTFYTPDFPVMTVGGVLELHEVKGHWTDKARVKIKVAAAQFPFWRFVAIQRAGRSGWQTEEF